MIPVFLLIFHSLPHSSLAIRPTLSDRLDFELANSTDSNVSLSTPRQGSFADIIDRALQHEFTDNDDQNEGNNNSLYLILDSNSNYFSFVRSRFILFNARGFGFSEYDFYLYVVVKFSSRISKFVFNVQLY